ncbi:hypothetical protein ACSBR1_012098 [Camellia fascicularis]
MGHVIGLDLSNSFLHGSINSSSSLFSLVHLQRLNLAYNDFDYSCIPSEIGHLSRLTSLNFSSIFSSQIPSEISKLSKLVSIDLSFNVDSSNSGLKLEKPGLRSILQNLTNLKVLRLNDVSISSEVPDTLANLTSLTTLVLENCGLRGSLPASLGNLTQLNYVSLSSNKFNVGILQLLGKLTELTKLELRDLNLYSSIPSVLSNLTQLTYSDLSSNHISGEITSHITNLTHLIWPDLSINQLRSPTPMSLFELKNLETLDLSFNNLSGLELEIFQMLKNLTFLDLSGDLTKLQVLILRSNKFYGTIGNPKIKLELPNLHIIDLSHNGFTGDLPSKYFQNWNAMKFFDVDEMKYMDTIIEVRTNNDSWGDGYCNKFEGVIPEFIGNLKGLKLLNLSKNNLNSGIPSCFGNLTNLESLDLSQNKLSGEIPQQLALLIFLEFLNVSNNHLTGPIPHGKQFNTFENNSYEGNSGLCGDSLSRKCGKLKAPPPLNLEQDNDSAFPRKVEWIFICAGCVSGIVVGMVIGHTITTRYHEWFIENFGRKQRKLRREKRRGHGNRS